MVAVDRLKGKISADEATADQRRAAKQEAVEAAQNAVENRRNSVVCRSALSKVNKALALNPNDAELEEWKSKINRRISALIREGQRVTKESIAEGMRPLIASGGQKFLLGPICQRHQRLLQSTFDGPQSHQHRSGPASRGRTGASQRQETI